MYQFINRHSTTKICINGLKALLFRISARNYLKESRIIHLKREIIKEQIEDNSLSIQVFFPIIRAFFYYYYYLYIYIYIYIYILNTLLFHGSMHCAVLHYCTHMLVQAPTALLHIRTMKAFCCNIHTAIFHIYM